jgi:hypothetical protein
MVLVKPPAAYSITHDKGEFKRFFISGYGRKKTGQACALSSFFAEKIFI